MAEVHNADSVEINKASSLCLLALQHWEQLVTKLQHARKYISSSSEDFIDCVVINTC